VGEAAEQPVESSGPMSKRSRYQSRNRPAAPRRSRRAEARRSFRTWTSGSRDARAAESSTNSDSRSGTTSVLLRVLNSPFGSGVDTRSRPARRESFDAWRDVRPRADHERPHSAAASRAIVRETGRPDPPRAIVRPRRGCPAGPPGAPRCARRRSRPPRLPNPEDRSAAQSADTSRSISRKSEPCPVCDSHRVRTLTHCPSQLLDEALPDRLPSQRAAASRSGSACMAGRGDRRCRRPRRRSSGPGQGVRTSASAPMERVVEVWVVRRPAASRSRPV